jgi:hypothetical protein
VSDRLRVALHPAAHRLELAVHNAVASWGVVPNAAGLHLTCTVPRSSGPYRHDRGTASHFTCHVEDPDA